MGILDKRLYYEDQYKKECISRVSEVAVKDGKVLVVLDNSPFYPTGGGQPCDSGWIGDQKVLDVFEKDGRVYNQLKEAPAGATVECRIDFSRRFDLMQQHTGEHLLSAAFLKEFDGINKGFHIGDEHCTIDINIPDLTEDMARIAELTANGYVYMDAPVSAHLTDRETAEALPLRAKIKVEDESIRIVEAEGIDMCACCGVHLRRTGEVGIIKINRIEKYKGMTRVYFRCGLRALEDYESKQRIISELVKLSSEQESKLPEKYAGMIERNAELVKSLNALRKKAAVHEAGALLAASASELIYAEYADAGFEEVQMTADEIAKNGRVFLGLSLKDNKIVLCHNGHSGINCGNLFKENIREYSGRGGGDSKRAQGSFAAAEDMMNFASLLKTRMGFDDRKRYLVQPSENI
jgi:alanyl-tRNA synthetase